jgi:hypothetical protein
MALDLDADLFLHIFNVYYKTKEIWIKLGSYEKLNHVESDRMCTYEERSWSEDLEERDSWETRT